ncbi:MAG: TlpA family protein disulfide reductase [Chloroflexota bacterium]|nr:TlpA family protein disulfide reductase [Chloroflexota bacterium]
MTDPLEPTPPTTPDRPERTRRVDRALVGPFSARHLALVAGAVAIIALALLVLMAPIGPPPAATPPRPGSGFFQVGDAVAGLRPGDRAPELEGTFNGQPVQLSDLDGEPIRLAELRGRVVWLNFWATWCPPCQEETPVLRDLHERYADDGLELVAVSVQETSVEDVRDYVETYDLGYTVGFDATSAIFHTYRVFGLPTQFFIDRDGVIRHIVLGPVTRDQAANLVTPLLAE